MTWLADVSRDDMALAQASGSRHSSEPWRLRDAVNPDLKECMGTVVDLCYARENLLCLLKILFDAKNEVWL